MKSNWKLRSKQHEDRIRGEMFDTGIGYGLELASIILSRHFGFGAKRLYKLNLEALRYIANVKDGAEYVLKGCIIRRNTTGRFYYQAELMDTKAKSSLIVTALDKIDERRESVESENTA